MVAHSASQRDRGAILPIALVISVVLAVVAVAIATYTATALRSTQVTEGRVDRLADAELGMQRVLNDLATDGCSASPGAGENGSTLSLESCQVETVTLGGDVPYSLVLTAEGVTGPLAFHRDGPQNEEIEINGQVYLAQNVTGSADPTKLLAPGLVVVQAATCPPGGVSSPGWLGATNVDCTTDDWETFTSVPSIPASPGFNAPTAPGCRVEEAFAGPRTISGSIQDDDVYFASGIYRVTGELELDGYVVAGHPGAVTLDASDPCYPVQQADVDNAASGGPQGVVFVVEGDGRIVIDGNDTVALFYGLDVGSDRRLSMVGYIDAPAPSGPYQPSTRDPNVDGNQASKREGIFITDHPNQAFAFYGEVWTPRGFIDVDTMSSNGDAGAAFQGGAVIARFKAKTSNDVSGIIFSGDEVPVVDYHRLRVTAAADGASTTVSVIAELDPGGSVSVKSWRVL